MTIPENLLRHQASPYLLQHADNPVHWRPWGEAALAEARTLDRPVLLSVGYAACHWCHVMAHESFEDGETATLMNRLFINIKVDREERPDIDQIYMAALHALGEQGGWPLTMFLTPEGAPFWGGTYFPPAPRWGRPSFRQVLEGVAGAYRTDHAAVLQNASALNQALAAASAATPGDRLTPSLLENVAARLLRRTDGVLGGMRGAPKFPNPPIFRFLWQQSRHTGATAGTEATCLLLRQMSQGGIYDHLGGGYARYSTDAQWLAPHFEKMLYDNAQILELLALAYAHDADPLWAARAEATIGWMLRDLSGDVVAGRKAFAASEDADSEGEEGRFYVWTRQEIDEALGEHAAAFAAAYDVTAQGNWEGRTILRRVTPPGDAEAEMRLARARARLLDIRGRRVRPARDAKVLADWNGLAIAALCRAAAVFDRPDWLDHAASAFGFIQAELAAPDGRVQHAWCAGGVTAAGLLDDHASMARAALALFQATSRAAYLDQAILWARAAVACFGDPGNGCFTSASDAADVPDCVGGRPRSVADNAVPSGNGMLTEVQAMLFHLTGDVAWRRAAEAGIGAFSGLGERLEAAPTLLAATGLLEAGALVVIAGDDAHAAALRRVALASADPAVMVLSGGGDRLPPSHPAHGKSLHQGRSAAYLCRGNVCGLPTSDPTALATALREARM